MSEKSKVSVNRRTLYGEEMIEIEKRAVGEEDGKIIITYEEALILLQELSRVSTRMAAIKERYTYSPTQSWAGYKLPQPYKEPDKQDE